MSAAFLSPLRLEKTGPARWVLIDPLQFRSVRYSGVFVVPAGFETDLTSVPRALWAVIPKVDRYDAAAVLHDAGYEGRLTTRAGHRIHTTKTVADALFHEACRALGVGRTRAAVMYTAVRLWGDPVRRVA